MSFQPARATFAGPRLNTVGDWIRRAWKRHDSRRVMAQLDPHLLADIGFAPADVEREARKPFWRE